MSNIKIGEFSKKHGVTQNTVRHYLDMGLITAKKIGGQYFFHKKDSKDMEEVIKLKQLGFNLNEILKLLTYLRLIGIETEDYKDMILTMLIEKKEDIEKISFKYQKMSFDINETIEELQTHKTKKTNLIGFPVSYLGILRCPDCKSNLNIKNGIIDNNMLTEGTAICRCGYHAIVRYGIFIEEKAMRKRFLNGNPWPSRDDYLKVVSSNFINFVYSGMAKMSDELKKYDTGSKLILELQHCVGYFLKHYIKNMSRDSTCIFVDYDIDKIIALKKNLELNQEHNNFIFLCCDIDRLPLCESSIDVMIDHWMTKDYVQTDKGFVLEKILPLLKSEGILIGSYPYFKTMNNIKNIHIDALDYFNRDKILKKIEFLGIKQLIANDIGPVVENNPYNFDISGKEVYQMIYLGRK